MTQPRRHPGTKARTIVMLAAAVAAVWLSASASAQNGNRASGHPNTLTAQEQKEGWVLLFDGKTLDKWNVTPELAKVWKVVDGTIKADLSGDGGTMYTKESFDNFALKVEFRAHPDINSGIILRQPPPQPAPAPGEKPARPAGGPGYELQIRDRNPGNYSSGDFLTGSVVNVGKAPHDAKIIANQWNTFDVTVDKDHFVVLFNGRKVVDANDSRRGSGTIGLQLAHPEDVRQANIEFRNLKVRRLP
jgi:3-keto-disaccharide hydrolase